MIEAWYPSSVKTPEARLRYYAKRFDTVEVDSPFYGIPAAATVSNWAQRTPGGFVFHVKAYGLMTGHAVDERSLTPGLAGRAYKVSPRGRVFDPEAAMVEQAFAQFADSLAPLRETGKLGGVLMQYPPAFQARDAEEERAGLRRIASDCELLAGDRMLVELRNATWVSGSARRNRVLSFLADLGASFVCVDAPRVETISAMPSVTAVTAPLAYVRFHGRNAATWDLRSGSAADRFDYLYETAELEEWAAPIKAMSADAETTFAMFNNCRHDYAPRNAHELARIIGPDAVRANGGLPGDDGREAGGGIQGELDLGV